MYFSIEKTPVTLIFKTSAVHSAPWPSPSLLEILNTILVHWRKQSLVARIVEQAVNLTCYETILSYCLASGQTLS